MIVRFIGDPTGYVVDNNIQVTTGDGFTLAYAGSKLVYIRLSLAYIMEPDELPERTEVGKAN